MKPPKYLAMIAKMHDAGIIPDTGINHIDILHDDWCNLLKGRGTCNCNPTVVYRKPPKG